MFAFANGLVLETNSPDIPSTMMGSWPSQVFLCPLAVPQLELLMPRQLILC